MKAKVAFIFVINKAKAMFTAIKDKNVKDIYNYQKQK